MPKREPEQVLEVGSSSNAHDALAKNVDTLRRLIPSSSITLDNSREFFTITGNVTEKSNQNNLGYDDIKITLPMQTPSLHFKGLDTFITDSGVLMPLPSHNVNVIGFMNQQLEQNIITSKEIAVKNGYDNYTFSLPSAALLDGYMDVHGYRTVGLPKSFQKITLGFTK